MGIKVLIFSFLLTFGQIYIFAQRSIKSYYNITSNNSRCNNSGGYTYLFSSEYPSDIDLYIFTSNNSNELIPIIRNDKMLPNYLQSIGDFLIFSVKITKQNQIQIYLPGCYNNYKLLAISDLNNRKMVANIGGPCINCGVTNVSIQLNEKIRRENIELKNTRYDSALVYIFDDNNVPLDFKGDNISLPYNSILTDVYNYKLERLIYSFNVNKNSSYNFYLPEGKFHSTILDPTSNKKISFLFEIPYNPPNYSYIINLPQDMPLKWVIPESSSGLTIGNPQTFSTGSRVSKDDFEKNKGTTTAVVLSEEEFLLMDQYIMVDFSDNKDFTIYESDKMQVETFDVVIPKSAAGEIFSVSYFNGPWEIKTKLKLGNNIIEGYNLKISCENQSCKGKLYFKQKQK